jgi:hypothetical protein
MMAKKDKKGDKKGGGDKKRRAPAPHPRSALDLGARCAGGLSQAARRALTGVRPHRQYMSEDSKGDQEVPPHPFPPRTKWTRRVPHPVLIGHATSLTPY